jgi:ribosome-associated protein
MGITDWFVIASGSNSRQVKTIADEVTVAVKRLGGDPPRIEGRGDASWVLLDFGDMVVHVFHTEAREFYGLERLWSDVRRIDWSDDVDDRLAAGA